MLKKVITMIDISHIIPVYTKRDYLPDTIHSLLHQDTSLSREFIFVDDCSKDDSVDVIKQCTQGLSNVHIITNKDNKGPSVRLNQGVLAAQGTYLHFLDHDDIVPKNGIAFLHKTLTANNGDFIYGTWKKTGLPAKELLDWTILDPFTVAISDNPIETVLNGRFKRMCTLTTRKLFLTAGGCDERIFIQDESLPLRLAFAAKKMIVTDAVVNLVPIELGNLSQNKTQLNHDRFLAYYYALADHTETPEQTRKLLYRRAVSAAWKWQRDSSALSFLSPLFLRYLYTQQFNDTPNQNVLDQLYRSFCILTNVLRVSNHSPFLVPATAP